MHVPPLNANIIIIAGLVFAGLYGLIAGKTRLRLLILSIYVGVVLAEQMSDVAGSTLKMLGRDQISWLLFGLPIVIFGILGGLRSGHDKGSAIANIIVGILAGALIVSSALHLLPTSELSAVDSDSFLAMNLQQFHLWLLGLLPLIVLVMGFFKKSEKKH
jgi:hypothetical protein